MKKNNSKAKEGEAITLTKAGAEGTSIESAGAEGNAAVSNREQKKSGFGKKKTDKKAKAAKEVKIKKKPKAVALSKAGAEGNSTTSNKKEPKAITGVMSDNKALVISQKAATPEVLKIENKLKRSGANPTIIVKSTETRVTEDGELTREEIRTYYANKNAEKGDPSKVVTKVTKNGKQIKEERRVYY